MTELPDGPTSAPDVGGDASRELLGRGSIYTVGTAIQLLAGVLVLPVVTRLFDSTAFGVAATALIVMQMFTIAGAAGLNGAITRQHFLGRGIHRERDAKALVFATAIVAAGVGSLAHLTGPLWARGFSGLRYTAPLEIAVWGSVPSAVYLALQSVLRAQDRPGRFVVVALISSVGGQLTGITLALAIARTPTWYLAGVVAGTTAAVGLAMAWVRPTLAPLRTAELTRAALAIGLPLVPHGLALYLLSYGDRVLIERYEGLEAVGRYHIAYLAGAVGVTALTAVNNAWAPLIYRAAAADRWSTLATTTATLLRLAPIVVGGLALGSPLLLRVAAPATYDMTDLAPLSAVVAGALVPYILYLSRTLVLGATGRTASLVFITPAAAFLNLCLNVMLIPWLGLIGAGLATVLTYGAWAALVGRVAGRLAMVPWDKALHVRTALLTGGAVAVGALAPADNAWFAGRAVAAFVLLTMLLTRVRRLTVVPTGAE